MVRPALRSRSFRRKKVKTPGGTSVTHYLKRDPSPSKCAMCRKPLHGVPKERNIKLSSLSRSQRRPERPYGGNLCSACMRQKIKDQFRK